ncbi:DUF4188 domain-containing protein [Methylobacterium sp. Leaf118]|uniref:DUF4188 domain-containing protein n=1 Tax=Methylobacterium sp. Leaf118 TaxID=2876562 RepID=UPI0022B7879C|nr:DUF4188 domain-containing protein [Methylobacterium sp. Leaf118]
MPDFSAHPDLVVIYLGMRVEAWRGLKTLLGFGPKIGRVGAARPEGLLHYENNLIFGLRPLQVGMRWYWRDMDSMVAWAKSDPHRQWWRDFLKDTGGVGIWHETYHMRGGMEAIYSETGAPVGFAAFLPMQEARGSLASRHRNHAAPSLVGLPLANDPDAPAAGRAPA